MSRQEDFQEQSERYANECGGTTQEKCATMTDHFAGAEYGYQYAIDNACEWLKENIYHRVYECGDRLGFPTADFIKDFRKAMEE